MKKIMIIVLSICLTQVWAGKYKIFVCKRDVRDIPISGMKHVYVKGVISADSESKMDDETSSSGSEKGFHFAISQQVFSSMPKEKLAAKLSKHSVDSVFYTTSRHQADVCEPILDTNSKQDYDYHIGMIEIGYSQLSSAKYSLYANHGHENCVTIAKKAVELSELKFPWPDMTFAHLSAVADDFNDCSHAWEKALGLRDGGTSLKEVVSSTSKLVILLIVPGKTLKMMKTMIA